MRFHRPFKAGELADVVEGIVEGNPDTLFLGLNDSHIVQEGEFCFAEHPKYFKIALQSKASGIILPKEAYIKEDSGKILLRVLDPMKAFLDLAQFTFQKAKEEGFRGRPPEIHPTAKLSEGVKIGLDVSIGQGTIIMPHVTIYDNCQIGKNCIIHAGTVIGADAFYYRKKGENGFDKFESLGRVVIEDNVEIGPMCTIDKGVTGDTFIGRDSKFDAHNHIGHDVIIGQRVLMAAQCGIAGFCRIEDDVILWGQVGVTKEVTIGKGAQVLARSGVMNNLSPGGRYFGNPALEASKKHREIILRSRLQEVFRKLGL